MSSRMPPRYLPTLTEVVDPHALVAGASAVVASAPALEAMATEPEAAAARSALPSPSTAPFQPSHGAAPVSAAPDRHALAQQLIRLVKPQLEAELRSIAQELFEAQFSALLPSMHLHIEEAVREAIEQALPEPPEAAD